MTALIWTTDEKKRKKSSKPEKGRRSKEQFSSSWRPPLVTRGWSTLGAQLPDWSDRQICAYVMFDYGPRVGIHHIGATVLVQYWDIFMVFRLGATASCIALWVELILRWTVHISGDTYESHALGHSQYILWATSPPIRWNCPRCGKKLTFEFYFIFSSDMVGRQ